MVSPKKGGLTATQEKILEKLCNQGGLELVDLPGNRNDASHLVRGDFIELLHGRYYICTKGREHVNRFLHA